MWDGLWSGDSSSDLLSNKHRPSELLGTQPLLCFRASLMGHDRLSPPHGSGPLYSQRCWSFIRLQYASLWNHVTQRDPYRSGPCLAVSTRSQGPRLSRAGGGENGLDTCCKSTAQTVQTRAVNQQARTITPKEAKTLLSVNTHHNSRLFNLDRTGSNL